tara:strand:- start:78 stop:329 length:252 start_codon:yes stop_codon:yes gene_type:complete
MKAAQTDKVKSTLYELEQLIKMNIDDLHVEQLGELIIAYGIHEANHLSTKPSKQTTQAFFEQEFSRKLQSRDSRSFLSPETTI